MGAGRPRVTSAVEQSAEAGGAAGGGRWTTDAVVDTSRVWSLTDAAGAAAAAASGADTAESKEASAAGLSLELGSKGGESVKAKAVSEEEQECVEGEAVSIEVEGATVGCV